MISGKTLCVILHYGCENDTNACVDSLKGERLLDIVIVDNDPSQSYRAPEAISSYVKVVKTGGLAGFSVGNNIGVNKYLNSSHHSVFILNNDTILVSGALDYLRSTLGSSGVGAVGPCMPYADNPDKVWACGGYVNKFTLAIGGLQPKFGFPYEVDYLPGAAILCRADIWRKIGGFQELYFLAYEEAELCLEIVKNGFKVMADPRAVVLHKVGMSSQLKPEYFYNSIRNRLIFSRYLYGEIIGRLYGVLITLFSLKSRRFGVFIRRIKLWARAVKDDAQRLPIDRGLLNSVARIFRE